MGARKSAKAEETNADCSVATDNLPSRVTRSKVKKLSDNGFQTTQNFAEGVALDAASMNRVSVDMPAIGGSSAPSCSSASSTLLPEPESIACSQTLNLDDPVESEFSHLSVNKGPSATIDFDVERKEVEIKDDSQSNNMNTSADYHSNDNYGKVDNQITDDALQPPMACTNNNFTIASGCSTTVSKEIKLNGELNSNTEIGELHNIDMRSNLLSPTSSSRVELNSKPVVDLEKQKRLNAELQRLTQEITFENTLKPVRIQQVQAFNPFRHLAAATEENAKSTDWASLAKMWIKTGEESTKVGEQLEEIERKRQENEEKMKEEQKRKIEEDTLKKRQAALALAQKLIQESQQKLAEERKKKDETHNVFTTLPMNRNKKESVRRQFQVIVDRIRDLIQEVQSLGAGQEQKADLGRTQDIQDHGDPPAEIAGGAQKEEEVGLGNGGMVDRICIMNGGEPDSETGEAIVIEAAGTRTEDSVTEEWDIPDRLPLLEEKIDISKEVDLEKNPALSREAEDQVRSLEAVINKTQEDSFVLQQVTAGGADTVLESVPLSENKVLDIPPIPTFQEINELIYLDDKVSKFGKKVKRPVERSVQCDCYAKALDCSDNRCLNRQMLFECRKCKAANCQNQRFRKRQYAAIEPFYTGPNKGFGVRAKEFIKKDTFIIEYIGEVVTQEDFAERVKKYSKDPTHTHHYIFEMGQKLIDATIKGNFSRFINHSCEPNAICLKWAVPKSPKDCSRIGFFAGCDIFPGEEITFDYQFINYGKKAQECHCGTPSCKGVIGQTVDDDEEDDEEEDDLYEEDESEDELHTEEDILKKEREAEIREWQSQQQINEIISAGKINGNRTSTYAARLVKNLMRVNEIGYKLRVLSFLEHMEPQFYQILKRKSLFDVFASWLSPADWSRNDMELKLEVIRLISLQDCHDSNIDQAAGWTVLCCQTVEQLAITDVPSVLAVRDTMEYLMDTVCGREDLDEDESGNRDLTNEQLFQKVRKCAQGLVLNKKFSDQKRSCALSKFKIPKKVKQERQAAAENPVAIYEGRVCQENIARSERREHFFSGSDRYRSKRYDRSPNCYDGRGIKRRFEFSHARRNQYYEPDYKRNRDYDYPRKHDYRHDSKTGKIRQDEGRPRTPPLEPVGQCCTSTEVMTEQKPFFHISGDAQPPPPGLVIPACNPVHASIDMEVSNGDSPPGTSFIRGGAFVSAIQQPNLPAAVPSNASLRLDVPESPFGVNPLGSYSSSYLNELNLSQHTNHHSDNPYLGDAFSYPHTISGWEMSINEDVIYQHFFGMTKEQRAAQLDYHKLYLKIITKVNNDIKRIEEEVEAAKHAVVAETIVGTEQGRAIGSVQHPPPPPPPRKKESKWWRVRVAGAVGDDQFYYWNKETHQTQWDIPSEPFDDYEQQMQPDSSADVEEKNTGNRTVEPFKSSSVPDDQMSSSSSVVRPNSRGSHYSSSNAHFTYEPSSSHIHIPEIKEEETLEKRHHHHDIHKIHGGSLKKSSTKHEFLKALEKTIKPVMWDYLRKILSADTERRTWLLKQVCKEMFKKETQREDCTMTLTRDVQKRIINYTKRFMERKCADDGKDLWKGYDMTHPSG